MFYAKQRWACIDIIYGDNLLSLPLKMLSITDIAFVIYFVIADKLSG